MSTHTVITHAPTPDASVVSERHAYGAFRASNTSDDFATWGAAQRLTTATEPMVRGTRSMGGGLIPLRNARHLYRDAAPVVTDAEWLATPSVLASGVSLAKAGDPVAPVAPVEVETEEIRLVGATGGWVTYERRSVVEGWRADSIRVGQYAMAAAWGMVLRGEA